MLSYRSLVEQARALEKERGISLDFTDKNIADSWVRCFEQGLRPNAEPLDSVLNQKELSQIHEKYQDIRQFITPECWDHWGQAMKPHLAEQDRCVPSHYGYPPEMD